MQKAFIEKRYCTIQRVINTNAAELIPVVSKRRRRGKKSG